MFRKRGVQPGDRLDIVSIQNGQLYMGGRLKVRRIVTREAVLEKGCDTLFDRKEWALRD